MSRYTLSRGMKIEWNNLNYLIEERLKNNQLIISNKISGERRTIEETALISSIFDGTAHILGYKNETKILEEKIQKNHVYDFSALDDSDMRKIDALRKFEYIKAVTSENEAVLSNDEILLVIKTVSEKIKDSRPPSSRTIRRWQKSYIEAGNDIRGLISANKSKGNRTRKFSSDAEISSQVLSIIETAIDEIYLTTQKNSVQAVYDRVEFCINKINKTRRETDKLPIPNTSSVYRIVADLDEYKADRARKGKRYADAKHKLLRKNHQPTRPLERVECDDTRVDLMVIDPENNLPLGRPWLMILIDVYTKMILGYFLSFYPPSHVTVMMAMKHAVRPKNYLKVKYPEIKNTWDTYGLMETLVVDNAKHWYGEGLLDSCQQLGINIQYTPVRIPWYKGSIERLMRTINTGLIHKQPGTTFSNIFDRLDYDPKKRICREVGATAKIS